MDEAAWLISNKDLKFLVGEPPSSTYSDHLTSCFPADNRLGETRLRGRARAVPPSPTPPRHKLLSLDPLKASLL